jgi:hypothetical protein
MKILLFGDGPQLKEKGKALREQNGWTVHLRSIARWAGDVETTGAVYFLTPAEAIRSAYKEHGNDCFLVEEPKDEEEAPGASNADADADAASGAEAGESLEAQQGSGESATEKPAEAMARRASAKKVK